MAYRVLSDFAHPARVCPSLPHRTRTLTCSAFIAGAAFSSIALVSGGAVLLGTGGNVGSLAAYSASRSALKVALVDPVAPAVVRRDPRMALETYTAAPVSVAARTEPRVTASLPIRGPTRMNVREATPLPHPRPVQLAAIPLPRERSVDVEITGSLGNPPHDLDAATTRPTHELVLAAITTKAKPSRALTPHEKLYGPVRFASLTPAGTMSDNGSGLPRAPYDRQTAVYVITDKKVYMPDGTVLEAHSGLYDKIDDPRFVRLRMRGATPPHVYDMTMRENLFHGVEAIRLNPIGDSRDVFNRAGLLAHSYMLGPNGQSNGCVSFKDYETFLDAFKAGKITRLAVLARLD
jgi:hypothetical protein